MNDRLLIEADLFCVFYDHVDNKSMVKKVPYHIMGNICCGIFFGEQYTTDGKVVVPGVADGSPFVHEFLQGFR